MCLAIYVGVEHPRPMVPSPDDHRGLELREVLAEAVVFRRRARQWHEALANRMGTPHVYEVNAGCACLFLSEGEDADDSKRLTAIAALRRYVEAALESGAVRLLICWGGDERKPAELQHLSAADIDHISFDGAWDRPLLVSIE